MPVILNLKKSMKRPQTCAAAQVLAAKACGDAFIPVALSCALFTPLRGMTR